MKEIFGVIKVENQNKLSPQRSQRTQRKTEGTNGASKSGTGLTAISAYKLSLRQNYYRGYVAPGCGNADSYARTGVRFRVSGSGSQLAYIRGVARWNGTLLGSVTGSAGTRIRMKVWDATARSFIGDVIYIDETDTDSLQPQRLNSSSSKSVLVSLQAGHQYLVYVLGLGTAYEPLQGLGSSYDFDQSDNTEGSWWSSITVDFQ